MAYTLFAVVTNSSLLEEASLPYSHAHIVELEQGLSLIPLMNKLYEEITSQKPDNRTIEKFDRLHPKVAEWINQLSTNGVVAYIEASFFGGEGTQSAIVLADNQEVLPPVQTESTYQKPVPLGEGAIDQALRRLGVSADGHLDEFEAVGLHRHRRTEDWTETDQ